MVTSPFFGNYTVEFALSIGVMAMMLRSWASLPTSIAVVTASAWYSFSYIYIYDRILTIARVGLVVTIVAIIIARSIWDLVRWLFCPKRRQQRRQQHTLVSTPKDDFHAEFTVFAQETLSRLDGIEARLDATTTVRPTIKE